MHHSHIGIAIPGDATLRYTSVSQRHVYDLPMPSLCHSGYNDRAYSGNTHLSLQVLSHKYTYALKLATSTVAFVKIKAGLSKVHIV